MTATPEGTVRVARDGSRGWHFIDKAKYEADPAAFVVVDADGKPVPADPLDHDGNGKKGGSLKPPADDELKALRAEYSARFGKKAFGGWDAAELRKRIDEAGA
mgnify:FL=1